MIPASLYQDVARAEKRQRLALARFRALRGTPEAGRALVMLRGWDAKLNELDAEYRERREDHLNEKGS